METELKHSLLLTHGTIYGYSAESAPWTAFAGSNVVRRTGPVEWRADLYTHENHKDMPVGMMTDNTPIDFISWSVVGHVSESGLEWWQQCMTLFMRHI